MLRVGDKAPSFKLACASGDDAKTVALSDFAGKYLVLYFYPKDDTPGCTREAQAFTAERKAFAAAGATVVGVSRDTIAKHGSFQKKYALTVPLLSDPDLTVHNQYGAWGKKMMYGKVIDGAIRSTFVIDPKGKLAAIFSPVKVDGHAEKVLEAIRTIQGEAPSSGTKAPAKKAAPAKKTAKTVATKTRKPATKKAATPTARKR